MFLVKVDHFPKIHWLFKMPELDFCLIFICVADPEGKKYQKRKN